MTLTTVHLVRVVVAVEVAVAALLLRDAQPVPALPLVHEALAGVQAPPRRAGALQVAVEPLANLPVHLAVPAAARRVLGVERLAARRVRLSG